MSRPNFTPAVQARRVNEILLKKKNTFSLYVILFPIVIYTRIFNICVFYIVIFSFIDLVLPLPFLLLLIIFLCTTWILVFIIIQFEILWFAQLSQLSKIVHLVKKYSDICCVRKFVLFFISYRCNVQKKCICRQRKNEKEKKERKKKLPY